MNTRTAQMRAAYATSVCYCCTIQPVDEYNRRAFANAYNGWANATADMRRCMQRIKDVVCPMCSVLGCKVHCDGNSKLFNWKPRGQPQQWQQQPHSCDFFAADAQRTLDITDAARGVRASLVVIEHIVLALVVPHVNALCMQVANRRDEAMDKQCNGVWAAA
jgi:hypothetical protein